jgi:YHS domain-containing protein
MMKSWKALGFLLVLAAGCTNTEDFSWITHTWTTDHGVFAMDHISRKRVDVTMAVRRPYLGETYYFENEDHAREFDRNPYAYLYTDNVAASLRPDRVDQN